MKAAIIILAAAVAFAALRILAPFAAAWSAAENSLNP